MKTFEWKRSSIALFAILLAVGAISCSGSAHSQNPKSEIRNSQITQAREVKPVNPKIVEANTRFGFKLFSEILKKDGKENVFVSPSSVAIALSMAYNGANGQTKTAMAKALEFQGMTLEEINQAHHNLKAALEKADPKVQLLIANSLWARQGVDFNPSFLDRNAKFYDAKVKSLDFEQPAAADEINSWVKESTRGKIPKIVDRINPNDVMFLMNAIYFKGKWTNEFDKSNTQTRPFTLVNGSKKQVPLMKRQGNYRYFETNQFQAISLPYGDERLSMYVFLPKSNLAAFQKSLTAQNWQTWMKQFSAREGQIQLPRFKMDYDVELKEALSALGMGIAFDDAADFSGLSKGTTKIDQVKHKTFVEVNEEGTEAAAVTSIGIVATSIRVPEEPFRMIVDRPFFSAIRDNQTGEILFMGTIVNPE
ncbi:serpin family protein [Leptolyngbya sp. NIES-2104]|uniref:serpin family protein n=1 Tax=Leptolyngbya sp. NIES-2104 TaxID=1552121 RepID=UPI0006ECB0A8|nr:serpin family protein [Leptolyngbya sp. NIES-2104]GAP95089.1 serine protease inhibitor [Leptolyngbya sp. NIES-2104]